MNKIILCFLAVFFMIIHVNAQPKPQPKPATTRPTTPPGPRMPPPQYVLKKDFEPKVQELENKIKSAINAGASARNNVVAVQDSVSQISTKVLDIENLLNSANFKIALNSDSLKTTQAKIDEVKLDLDKQVQFLKGEIDKSYNFIYILLALCIILPAGVFMMMLNLNKKAHLEIRNFTERMNADIQKNYISQQEEMKKIKSGIEGDVMNAKSETNMLITRDRDANTAQFKKLQQLIDLKQDKAPEEEEPETEA